MAAVDLKSLSREQFRKFLDSFDVVLSDCDGVLWREADTIDGSPETVAEFKALGKKFFYITNNNCKTRSELVEKCKSHQYDATVDDILCSSYLAAVYLKEKNFNKKVYVVGSEGISQELAAQGIESCGVGPDLALSDPLDTVVNFQRDPEIGAVVVGLDKDFSYPKLIKAATYAQDPLVHFIGTNPDYERPSPNDNLYPDAGCFLRSIEAAAARDAVVLGKPEPFVSDLIMKKYGVDPPRTLMIGDNPSTDILLGKRCAFTTLLVLSGVTSREKLENMKRSPQDSIVPDYFADRLSDFLYHLRSH